jgi:hypothetical protein
MEKVIGPENDPLGVISRVKGEYGKKSIRVVY